MASTDVKNVIVLNYLNTVYPKIGSEFAKAAKIVTTELPEGTKSIDEMVDFFFNNPAKNSPNDTSSTKRKHKNEEEEVPVVVAPAANGKRKKGANAAAKSAKKAEEKSSEEEADAAKTAEAAESNDEEEVAVKAITKMNSYYIEHLNLYHAIINAIYLIEDAWGITKWECSEEFELYANKL